MPRTFQAAISGASEGITSIDIAFGETAQNTDIVPDVIEAIQQLNLKGGKGIKFNGKASLPAAMALAHAVAHLFGFVACNDPKLGGYVVAISHDPAYKPGDLLP